ncbi:sulfotransferase domain-containing protein [Pseudoruegeria sp. SHC-113]|uniref:sulfotransferase domain-containing protein n=1 Tax=Pseudoruegeria sp. SHC-113 TaxID=2855439 RepID=UPI0021BB953B|nr:sulfotransferase domain-containing protein [Pseudoruegeria sp. SHC-113]MCT8161682.1 sulfotransferase domain-containing protein [Pseudoruegeria sp. SHC-113]
MSAPEVNFVVAGTQKGGTRAFGHFLRQHPQIRLSHPDAPEPHFFDMKFKDAHPGDYAPYHALFPPRAAETTTGDITPIYMFLPEIAARIHAYNPAMKWILLLRDPVARAYSQWNMQYEKGWETREFLDALHHESRSRAELGRHPFFSYIQRGRYSLQIKNLLSVFPRENLLLLKSSDLRDAHDEALDTACDFLGVDRFTVPAARVHARSYPPMCSKARALLLRVFRSEVDWLEAETGWDLRAWRG